MSENKEELNEGQVTNNNLDNQVVPDASPIVEPQVVEPPVVTPPVVEAQVLTPPEQVSPAPVVAETPSVENNVNNLSEKTKDEEAKFPFFVIFVLILLIVFVFFLPEISKHVKNPFAAKEVVQEKEEQKEKDKEKVVDEKPKTRKDKLGLAVNDNIKPELSEIAILTGSNLGAIKVTNDLEKIEFLLEDGNTKIIYKLEDGILKSSMALSDENIATSTKIFETLVREIAKLHNISVEDINYTLESDITNSFTIAQGFSKRLENEKYYYEINPNLRFNYLDSKRSYLTEDDLGSKLNLISQTFTKTTDFYAVHIEIKDETVITFGEKDKNTEVSKKSLDSIMNVLLNSEDLKTYEDNFSSLKDLEESIFKMETSVDDNSDRFKDLNVIRLTINKRIR